MNNYVNYDQVQDMTQTVIDGTLIHENSEILVDLKTVLDKLFSFQVLKMPFSSKIYQIFSLKSMSRSMYITTLIIFHVVF